MKKSRLASIFALALVGAIAVTTAFAGTSRESKPAAPAHVHTSTATSDKAADLRVALNRLLGEHALLAIQTTQAGYSGDEDYAALARALDRNSVELSRAVGGVFGAAAGKKFLNGRALWRDHIRFFVAYTDALKGKNAAGQQKAVNDLKGYIEAFSAFLASATGLPKSALRASITEHVMQLKGQLDAYAKGRYSRSSTLSRAAYRHMGMTGDILSAAIVKRFPARYR